MLIGSVRSRIVVVTPLSQFRNVADLVVILVAFCQICLLQKKKNIYIHTERFVTGIAVEGMNIRNV